MNSKILVLMSTLLVLSSLNARSAQAYCSLMGTTHTGDGAAAAIPFGSINISSTYLQPVGTLLASAVVPPTNYNWASANAETVLWECDRVDLPNIEFLVATNGDDIFGGFWDIGAQDGLPDVYATYFRYIGIKQTMDNVVLTRYWKSMPVKSYGISSRGRIQIRLKDLPTMRAEVYRVSNIPPYSGSTSAFCGNVTIATGPYSACHQPNAYIQLKGPGLTHDQPGEDSAYRFLFWGALNGFAYSMYKGGNHLYNDPTCVARNATPLVLFETVSSTALAANQSVQADFDVSIECSNNVVSGTSARQVALGLQASPGAYAAAKKLGLVNTQNGVTALVSDQYDDPQMAKGVGIFLKSASGKEQNFLGQPGVTGGGANAGWYPALNGAQPIGSTTSGYNHYMQRYTAVLKKLPGNIPIQAGKVHSTAYVLVKLQ